MLQLTYVSWKETAIQATVRYVPLSFPWIRTISFDTANQQPLNLSLRVEHSTNYKIGGITSRYLGNRQLRKVSGIKEGRTFLKEYFHRCSSRGMRISSRYICNKSSFDIEARRCSIATSTFQFMHVVGLLQQWYKQKSKSYQLYNRLTTKNCHLLKLS